MTAINRQRVLIISRNSETRNEMVTLLSGYGYFVEYSNNRSDGIRKFRAHKPPIVVVDIPVLRAFPKRLFKLVQKVRKNTIVLIAANKREEDQAFEHLRLGAYDVLNLPLRTEFLKLTLNRAQAHHRLLIENIFVKNLMLFALLMLPIWLLLGGLLLTP